MSTMKWVWFTALVCVSPGLALYHEMSSRVFTVPLMANASFGFSVSSVSRGPTSKLVVGAPLADRIGHIYTCDLTSKHQTCTSVDNSMNKRPNTDRVSVGQHYWFGATVKGTNDFFVGCSPRSVDNTAIKIYESTSVGTYGHCFLYQHSKPPELVENISLVDRRKNATKLEETMDSFGWSLFVDPDDSILIGSPAMISGRVMKRKRLQKSYSYITGNQTTTPFNFGYAVASGNFLSSKNSIAVGSPYGKKGFGNVKFLIETSTSFRGAKELIGPAVGSMFGAVLCPAKMSAAATGRMTDLLVGAPTFTAGGNDYNVGAVYVYTAKETLSKRNITGESSGSQFGSAIISLGDLNNDTIDVPGNAFYMNSFKDFPYPPTPPLYAKIAISAPYEDDGRGRVYLFSGADIMGDGILKPIQTITPEPTYRSFGYSLAVLRDYDDNGCNELAIGAPESNKVMVFRCLAAMSIKLLPFKSIVAGTNGVDKREPLQLCFDAKFPDKPSVVKTDILVEIRIHHDGAKLNSPKDEKVLFNINHADIKKEQKYCKTITLFMSGTSGDYNNKIRYELSASLQIDPLTKEDFESTEVILNKQSKLSLEGSIWAQECGNRPCVPNLKMNIEFTETSPYKIGSSNSINASIEIDNTGEVAYVACVRVKVEGTSVSDFCKVDSKDNANTVLICKPNQLLRRGSSWSLETMVLDTTKLTNEDKSINVTVELYEQCDSTITYSNTTEFHLVADAASVNVNGRTDEGQDDMVNLTRSDINMQKTFEHIYTISNTGPTNWVNIEMTISVQKQDFFIVLIDKICKASNTTVSVETLIYTCFAPKLDSNAKLEVKLRMQVVTHEINDRIQKEKLTVYSNISMDLVGTPKNASVTSELRLIEGKIPIWIIVLASILALIILVIIFFILRECGFLKRKNKENLKRARMSVRRQTIMRQSMLNRPRSEDREKIINEANTSQENNKKKKDRRVVVNDF